MKTCLNDDVKQVMFGNWTDKSAPKQYWRDVTAVAMFIASALQHPTPPCNSRNPRMSTIVVQQHKEKFGAANVYCQLADINMVADKWAQAGKQGEPSEEFIYSCFVHDAQVYRNAYMQMIDLVPHYKNMICARADYYELLFTTKQQLETWLTEKGSEGFYLKRYKSKDIEELTRKLKNICGFEK